MGEVYRARDTRLERVVAVKVLPTNQSTRSVVTATLGARSESGFETLSSSHLHDIGHQNGVDFLVRELVEGEMLEHRLIKGPLPPELTIRFAAQIADAEEEGSRDGCGTAKSGSIYRRKGK